MADWKCSKCNVDMEEVFDIALIYEIGRAHV